MQVTLVGQSAYLKFENFHVLNIKYTETIKFNNNYFDDSLFAYHQINYNFKLTSEYIVNKIISVPCSEAEIKTLEDWSWTDKPKIIIQNGLSNNTYYSKVKVYPFFLKDNTPHKIEEIQLDLKESQSKNELNFRSSNNINKSVLSNGKWFKFKIKNSGVFKFSYENLFDLNILKNPIPNNKIAIYSNSSKMLGFQVGDRRPKDLSQIPTKITGSYDGMF